MKNDANRPAMGVDPMMGFEVAATMTRAMFHSMSVWNREMAKFVGHRLEMDAKLQDELARCDNAFEAFESLTKFMQTAFAEYSEEAKTVQDLAANTAEENIIAMESELGRTKAPILD